MTTAEEIAERLNVIAPAIRPGARAVASVARLSGGAVNEIWAFDLIVGDFVAPLVLRRGAGGRRTHGGAIALATEAAVVSRAARQGVPVATPRYILQPGDGLGEGFVSDRIAGETLGGRIARSPQLAEARVGLAYRCGEVLAAIHTLDTSGLRLETRAGTAFLAEQASQYARLRQPRPVLALALRWLRAHVPPDHPLTFVHGDFRNGNMIVGAEALRAVLDWEGAHISDPMSDLGFLCAASWRFGVVDKPVGGFGTREDLFAGYAAAGGRPDPRRSYFWQVFGSFRWAIMCAATVDGGALGSSPVESALIARRTSESEIDLLDLVTGACA